MKGEPQYLDESEAEALCNDPGCSVHADGDRVCPVIMVEQLTAEYIRRGI